MSYLLAKATDMRLLSKGQESTAQTRMPRSGFTRWIRMRLCLSTGADDSVYEYCVRICDWDASRMGLELARVTTNSREPVISHASRSVKNERWERVGGTHLTLAVDHVERDADKTQRENTLRHRPADHVLRVAREQVIAPEQVALQARTHIDSNSSHVAYVAPTHICRSYRSHQRIMIRFIAHLRSMINCFVLLYRALYIMRRSYYLFMVTRDLPMWWKMWRQLLCAREDTWSRARRWRSLWMNE